jgi:hypothetical protein
VLDVAGNQTENAISIDSLVVLNIAGNQTENAISIDSLVVLDVAGNQTESHSYRIEVFFTLCI